MSIFINAAGILIQKHHRTMSTVYTFADCSGVFSQCGSSTFTEENYLNTS